MQEVMRSGKQKDKSVPMTLTLTDADNRPSEVRPSVSADDNKVFSEILKTKKKNYSSKKTKYRQTSVQATKKNKA